VVIVGACTSAFLPTFWALPTKLLTESAAAASIGLINSVGNLGGFAGPYAMGALRSATNSFTPGLVLLVICLFGAGLVVVSLRVREGLPMVTLEPKAGF
jgi:nitrate/nitrite transporter NarK